MIISDDLMITDEPMTKTEPEVTTSAMDHGRDPSWVEPKYGKHQHWGKKGLDYEPTVNRNSGHSMCI